LAAQDRRFTLNKEDRQPKLTSRRLERTNRTLRGITGLHILEMKASVANGKVAEYRVTMEVTFILEG
jgi:flavin-binding protein dodecin